MAESDPEVGPALVDVGGLSLRDLEAVGGPVIVEALRSVLDPRTAGMEVVAGFVNDPE